LVTTTFFVQAMPSHQFLNPPGLYPHPPPCTSIVLVACCFRPQNSALHSNIPFFLHTPGTAIVHCKPLEVSFAPCFFVQVPPHSDYTHELQLS
jgi:hypothetical protein